MSIRSELGVGTSVEVVLPTDTEAVLEDRLSDEPPHLAVA